MKKLLAILSISIIACFILACSLPLKVMTLALPSGEYRLEAPLDMPVFFPWEGQLLGCKSYPSGAKACMVETYNEDQTIFAIPLLVSLKKNDFHIVAVQFAYFKDKDYKDVVMRYAEDLKFMQSGIPSDKLSWVKEPTKWETIEGWLQMMKVEVRWAI